MRSLAKLVNVNSPDLVLFVGEALVGNEAVAQVTGFNTVALRVLGVARARIIDGIMLTKFDTISTRWAPRSRSSTRRASPSSSSASARRTPTSATSTLTTEKCNSPHGLTIPLRVRRRCKDTREGL